MTRAPFYLLALGFLLSFPVAAAQAENPLDGLGTSQQSPPDPESEPNIDPGSLPGKVEGANPGLGEGANAPNAPGAGTGFRDVGGAVAAAVADDWALTSMVTIGLGGVGLLSWVLASRYVDPMVALKNPQRSMLYGFIKGNPGVHLKQLSTEFHMKTSTVLWHIRKLEHADLVRSKKANGYRVFYPVSGGMEAKQLSTAVTALSNGNARSIFEFVALNPGAHRRILSGRLTINPGTVRWHLKKLREAGLVAELAQDRFSTYYATEMGLKAMRQVASLPIEVTAPVIQVAALPTTEPLGEDDEAEPIPAS